MSSTTPVDKCSHNIPVANCLTYIGEHIVYNALEGRCVIQDAGCSIQKVRDHSFHDFKSCIKECENSAPVQFLPATRLDRHTMWKCGYRVPQHNCGVFIGNAIVFDSDLGYCRIQTMGCTPAEVGFYSFDSFEDCERTCQRVGQRWTIPSNPAVATLEPETLPTTNKPWVTVFSTGTLPYYYQSTIVPPTLPAVSDSRCLYRKPTITCHQFIGNHWVFDSVTDHCVLQNTGCRRVLVEMQSFKSFWDCERSCRPHVTSDHDLRCNYRPPAETCGSPIGPLFVFDSIHQLCILQRFGCHLDDVLPFSFKTFEDCQQTCRASNEGH